MEKKIKLLIDTDIGDDIDDALALALALKLPEVEPVGVTTVFADTDIRAREAMKMLACAGISVPVYAGMPGKNGFSRCGFSQYEEDLEDEAYTPCNDASKDGGSAAVHFIADCARKYGSELIIVGIGAMTNIAAAFELDAAAMRSVGKISLMCGSFYKAVNEWNVLCDSHAAETVLGAGIPVECYGLDVTLRTGLTGPQYKRILNYSGDDKLLKYLAVLTRKWHDFTGNLPMLHDPLALFNAVRPGMVFMEPQSVNVITEGEFEGVILNRDRNLTYFGDKPDLPRINVAKDVRERDFLDEFFSVLYKEDV